MLFNNLGRRIPSEECRVFNPSDNTFYKLNQPPIDYEQQLRKSAQLGLVTDACSYESFKGISENIYQWIDGTPQWKNLTLGPSIPFTLHIPDLEKDEGSQLSERFLPLIKSECSKRPVGEFRATIQGNSKLEGSFSVDPNTNYQRFISQSRKGRVTGLYFPCAFQEYDISSQRRQLSRITSEAPFQLCVSGHIEISYSLSLYPELLFDSRYYSPILCASPLVHHDSRMIPIFKSYGPHTEFWLMSQMLTPSTTQVSEQWSGGLTIYDF